MFLMECKYICLAREVMNSFSELALNSNVGFSTTNNFVTSNHPQTEVQS